MKNITKILAILLALFLFAGIIASCDQETTVDSLFVKGAEESTKTDDTTSTDTTPTAGRILIYAEDGSKRLSVWDALSPTDYDVPSGNVADSDFRAIDALMAGKIIQGLSFEGVKNIEGKFSEERETPLLQLRFSEDLEYIGENVFGTSYNLFEVEFLGSVPEIEVSAFPAADAYYSEDCSFVTPEGSDAEEWIDALKPFIGDYGHLDSDATIILDANADYYKDKVDADFETPEFPEDAVTSWHAYVGDKAGGAATPTNAGYVFLGFYADKDTTATQVFDADGNAVAGATSYTNADGLWLCSGDVTLYAHWEKIPLPYYVKGAAFIKEYAGIQLPVWDNKIGATNDNSVDWSTATGMHFYMDSDIEEDMIGSLETLTTDLGRCDSNEEKRTNINEAEYSYMTTATWFGVALAEKYQTDDYKMMRIQIGMNQIVNNSKAEFVYLSIDISFINSAAGTRGPSGGYIFYDVDEDNSTENDGAGPDGLKSDVCNWRFLEAAPEDLSGQYVWGDKGKEAGTGTAIGLGQENTRSIVQNASSETGHLGNAAMACQAYGGGGYSDWFLPSKDELEQMYLNLKRNEIGNFQEDTYWSSSEYFSDYAWQKYFRGGGAWLYNFTRDNSVRVRPVRAFPVISH